MFTSQPRVAKIFRFITVASAITTISACSVDSQRLTDLTRTDSVSKSQANASPDAVTSRPLDNAGIPASRPSWQTGQRTPAPSANGQEPAKPSGTVRVERGQTLYSIANANGITVSHLAAANRIRAPYSISVGQTLVIPGVSAPTSPAPSFAPRQAVPATAPVPAPNYADSGTHRVKRGETLFALGRTYSMNPYNIAKFNNLTAPYSLKAGQVVRIPGKSKNATWQEPQPVKPAKPAQTATAPASTPAKPSTSAVTAQKTEDQAGKSSALIASGFRWPVRGRVISSFGPKDNGSRNEGINIAVPEGTSVRAAESGVVAYAGNELKGYGNLILIRHKDGWVTAYAHNRDLFVQRGDTVKRGEEIAKAGSTGSVDTPQLHFELRKGASAVDPMRYLGSATASN